MKVHLWGSESSMYGHHHVGAQGAASETRNSMYFYSTFAPKDGRKNGDYDSMCYHMHLYMSWVAFFCKELDLLFLRVKFFIIFWSFVYLLILFWGFVCLWLFNSLFCFGFFYLFFFDVFLCCQRFRGNV